MQEMKEIEAMIRRYETLKVKLNAMTAKAPLRMKSDVRDEMRAIGEDLNAIGLELDYFGRWV